MIAEAARVQVYSGLDGMRYLGADPRAPADDLERHVMTLLHNRIVAETDKLSRG